MPLLHLFVFLAGLLLSGAAAAQTLEELVQKLPDGGFEDRARVIEQIAATGDERAAGILDRLAARELEVLKADGRVVRVVKEGKTETAVDPFSGEKIAELGRRDTQSIKLNNNLRRAIEKALGALRLGAAEPAKRLEAAEAIFRARDASQLEALDAALATETVPNVAAAMRRARAAVTLGSNRPEAEQIEAIETLASEGGRDALGILAAAMNAESPAVADAARSAVADFERRQQLWQVAENVWYGLSLGSVLMLAAIGLAITFGVMGVINMAHGELVMLGAYTTFVVQEIIRTHAVWLFDWSLAIALPLAFLVSAAVGVMIERGVCRYLYGRPLETLLATWGVSLILQQAVRSIFGPNNREVGNPGWMSGAFELGAITITYNRLWIMVFALIVFAVLLLVLKRTPVGLQMRAVTQNRPMASAMGIRTGWIDATTFGLGAGIAGIAGVALSQIGNVSPNLGQTYIVDSFMVVVFGGVGNLWGALAGAFTLGVANKFLEPFAGAVLAKVLVLVFIILFIQKRPRGMFALRGRSVEQ
ncbi:urea ABC transporter permease subunit UrtB [Limibaculum sp. M0105]|uniref:Urea ABC transporter permease subunit UrtB n=1 Tax=Thermohalobaculum xanthum TaxID=2753746 RepID=A0A8J7M4Z6_9RHOB|nr:urea ABC transporter permease subunit UrtB [Thermohalobaculum xanthum]MBK0398260.1 urea ABC transporter permease subunit UrtB [Thermohalobaculum xanthum]